MDNPYQNTFLPNTILTGTIVNIVEDCDISYTDLNAEQVEHIFEVMIRKTRLKKLNIRGNCLRSALLVLMKTRFSFEILNFIYFRTIHPSTLSLTLNKMEEINLWSTRLTKPQVMELFNQMAIQTHLTIVNLGENSLISIPAIIFAKAIFKLSVVKLENTYLRKLQLSSMFDDLLVHCRLKILDINSNNFSEVEEEKMSVIFNKLSELNINQTNLTGLQVKGLFKKMLEFTNLKILQMNEVDLSLVPANYLAEAVNMVRKLIFSKLIFSICQNHVTVTFYKPKRYLLTDRRD